MSDISKIFEDSISRRGLLAVGGISALALLASVPGAEALAVKSVGDSTLLNDSERDAWNLVVAYLSARALSIIGGNSESILNSIWADSPDTRSWERHRAGLMSSLGSQEAWNGRMENAWSEPSLLRVSRANGLLKFYVRDVTEIRWRPAPSTQNVELLPVELELRKENPGKFGIGLPGYAYTSSAFGEEHVITLVPNAGSWKIIADGYQDMPTIGNSPDWASSATDFQEFRSSFKSANLRTGTVPPSTFNTLGRTFDWSSAYNYGLTWATSRNSSYKDYSLSGGDCANFVSQCFTAGGYPIDPTWYKYSNAWVNNSSLRSWLISSGRGIPASVVGALGFADIINYDLAPINGVTDHVAIVTNLFPTQVSSHTADVRNVSPTYFAATAQCSYAITLVSY